MNAIHKYNQKVTLIAIFWILVFASILTFTGVIYTHFQNQSLILSRDIWETNKQIAIAQDGIDSISSIQDKIEKLLTITKIQEHLALENSQLRPMSDRQVIVIKASDIKHYPEQVATLTRSK